MIDLTSAVILTKNNERTLKRVLESIAFLNEVIIYDTGSTDETLTIAASFSNVRIFKGPLNGFGPARNIAAKHAKNNWILALDSDEVISPSLSEELSSLQLSSNCIYSFPFKNFYRSKHIKWCGWHPESHIRLYNKTVTEFCSSHIHEGVEIKNLRVTPLAGYIEHYPYHSTGDFLQKMQKYSDLFAEQNKGKKRSSFSKAIFHAVFAFFKSYILKRGIFGGKEGLIISIYNANTAFYKYLKLMESNECS